MIDPVEPTDTKLALAPPWTAAARFAFRFVAIYWALFFLDQGVLELLLWMVPGLSYPVAWITRPLHLAAQWTGVHLFGLTGVAATEHPTTAGDTALQYPKPMPETFPLQARGFHWVQEYSYNR